MNNDKDHFVIVQNNYPWKRKTFMDIIIFYIYNEFKCNVLGNDYFNLPTVFLIQK